MADANAKTNSQDQDNEVVKNEVEEQLSLDASPEQRADAGAEDLGVDELQTELDQANNRVLRAQAELENFRKRARRDMEEQRQYANLPLIADLLPAIDNLERAIEAAEKDESASGLVEGVRMVSQHVLAILGQHSCIPVEAEGRPFDPNVHEAIAQEASDDIPSGMVTRIVRVGYQLHGRVVRPSQVMVSTGPPDPGPESTELESDQASNRE